MHRLFSSNLPSGSEPISSDGKMFISDTFGLLLSRTFCKYVTVFVVFPTYAQLLFIQNSEYDQEMPQSQTADKPMAPRGRATQLSQDTKKTN